MGKVVGLDDLLGQRKLIEGPKSCEVEIISLASAPSTSSTKHHER